MTVSSHGVLFSADFQHLVLSPKLSSGTSADFRCRIIFEIVLSTAMSPIELHRLPCSQVSDAIQNGNPPISILKSIESMNGTCKDARGGWEDVKLK